MSEGELYEKIGALGARVTALESLVKRLDSGAGGGQASGGSNNREGRIASDQDLDGQYGNPEIRYDPKERYWTGASYVGQRFSECPSDYLLAMATGLEATVWGLNKGAEECGTGGDPDGAEAKLKKAKFKSLDAARARGWAKRNAGAQAAPQSPSAAPTRQPRQSVPQGPPKAAQDDYDFASPDDEIPF